MPIRSQRVLAALLLVSATVAAGCSDAHPEAVGSDSPRLIDPAPPGMEVELLGRGEPAETSNPALADLPVEVYGTGDDPFTEPVYVVTTTPFHAEETADARIGRMRELAANRSFSVGEVDGVVTRNFGSTDGSLKVVWPADPGTLLVVASATAEVDELVAVAAHVSLGGDGVPAVGDDAGLDRIGGLGADAVGRPNRTTFRVSTGEEGMVGAPLVTVAPVTPDEQVAYRAIMVEDPATALRTDSSCCDPELLHPPRQLDVHGAEAHVGTLDTGRRALVVSGDPGLVVISSGGRTTPIHGDEALVEIAEHLREATDEEVDALIERERAAVTEEAYEEATRSLPLQYPSVEVVGRVEVRDRDVVVGAGTLTAEATGLGGQPLEPEPMICASYFGEPDFGEPGGGIGCIQRSAWADADVAARGSWDGILVVGDDRLETVALVSPDGKELAGAVLPLDLGDGYPDRLGVLYARVAVQADPEIDAASAVTLIARDAAGQELFRTPVGEVAPLEITG